MNKTSKLEFVRRIFYPKARVDLWFEILTCLTRSHFKILEIGSGSGRGLQNQRYPKAAKIVGIDLDERVLSNPYLDESFNISAYDLGDYFAGAEFDIIYSHMVAEHIDDADKFISIQLNCLRPSGVLIHSTVSKYYWTSLINDLVPVSMKNWLIKTLGSGRESEDIFPAHYELNSEARIREICKNLNIHFRIIRQDEPPGYLRRSFILMFLYTMLHRPLQIFFPAIRPTFIFLLSKKEIPRELLKI